MTCILCDCLLTCPNWNGNSKNVVKLFSMKIHTEVKLNEIIQMQFPVAVAADSKKDHTKAISISMLLHFFIVNMYGILV